MDYGYRLIKLPPCPALPTPMASHTDMLLCRLGNELICSEEYRNHEPEIVCAINDICVGLGIKLLFTNERFGGVYPFDCLLNALQIADKVFCREASISKFVIERAREMNLQICPVKQGYPACTVLRLDDSRVITADRGMARAIRSQGIAVTEIANGGINLTPYPYGFIGGCAARADGAVYFLGDPSTHPSFPAISQAISEAGLTIRPLSDEPLRDLGGLILLG